MFTPTSYGKCDHCWHRLRRTHGRHLYRPGQPSLRLFLKAASPAASSPPPRRVENFPGFPEGVDGPDLIVRMHQQAEKFGARFQYGTVEEFEHAGTHTRLKVDGEWMETKTLIIASGASPRYLGIDREKELDRSWPDLLRDLRRRVSTATCRSAWWADGDSACEEATFLTRFASKVVPDPPSRQRCGPRKSWPTGRWTIPRSSRSGTAPSRNTSPMKAGEVTAVKLFNTVNGAERASWR